jgi:ribosomal protein L44E
MNTERTRKPGTKREVLRCRSCGDALPADGYYEVGVELASGSWAWTVCKPCHELVQEVLRVQREPRQPGLRWGQRRLASALSLLDLLPE